MQRGSVSGRDLYFDLSAALKEKRKKKKENSSEARRGLNFPEFSTVISGTSRLRIGTDDFYPPRGKKKKNARNISASDIIPRSSCVRFYFPRGFGYSVLRAFDEEKWKFPFGIEQ